VSTPIADELVDTLGEAAHVGNVERAIERYRTTDFEMIVARAAHDAWNAKLVIELRSGI
jgi:hypothetical protein